MNRKGFTLIEVIVTMVIVGIIVISISSLLSTGFLGIIRSGHKAKAAYEAQRDMSEKIMTNDFSGTQRLEINFAGIPPIEIDVNLIESQEEINGKTSTMTSFMPVP